VTNYHVIATGNVAVVKFADGTVVPVDDVLATDKFHDLAVSHLVKKLVPVAPEQELIAHCSAPFEDTAGPGGLLPGEIPGILNICAICAASLSSAVPPTFMALPSNQALPRCTVDGTLQPRE
jgi:hypothetical protein